MTWFKDVLTENDGETYCTARVAVAIVLTFFLGLSVYSVYRTGTFSMTDFGTGSMGILTGGAALIAGKQFSGKQ